MTERKKDIPDIEITGIYEAEADDGMAIGIEHVHAGDGVELHHLDVAANSEEAADDIRRQFEDVHEVDSDQVMESRESRSSSFGFSSNKWRSSWNPQGPKKNWDARSLEDDLDVN